MAVGFILLPRLALIVTTNVAQWSYLASYFDRAVELHATGNYAENGTPTAYCPLGYPAFLAAVMKVTAPTVLVGQGSQRKEFSNGRRAQMVAGKIFAQLFCNSWGEI